MTISDAFGSSSVDLKSSSSWSSLRQKESVDLGVGMPSGRASSPFVDNFDISAIGTPMAHLMYGGKRSDESERLGKGLLHVLNVKTAGLVACTDQAREGCMIIRLLSDHTVADEVTITLVNRQDQDSLPSFLDRAEIERPCIMSIARCS